jgi:DNA-binding CsgD family transcriptional regulator
MTGSSLTLSAADRALVLATQQAFLSPLDAESPLAWYRRASRPLKALLRADSCALYLPHAETPWALSEEFSMAELTAFPARLEPLMQSIPVHTRAHTIGAYARDDVFRDCLAKYYGSAYYNDYIVPVRALDGLGLSVARDAAHVTPSHGTTANFYFYHERLKGRRFAARELALLQLVYPAFVAGVQMWWHLAARRAQVADTWDALDDIVVVCDMYGTVVHQSAAAEKLLSLEPEAAVLRAAVDTAIRSMRSPRTRSNADRGRPRASAGQPRVVHTTAGSYRVDRAFLNRFPGAVEPTSSYIVVRLQRIEPTRLIAAELSDDFGLTPAQARIAQLLVDGRANTEIARTLAVSVHTVRHHVAAVLGKCGVHSRQHLHTVFNSHLR